MSGTEQVSRQVEIPREATPEAFSVLSDWGGDSGTVVVRVGFSGAMPSAFSVSSFPVSIPAVITVTCGLLDHQLGRWELGPLRVCPRLLSTLTTPDGAWGRSLVGAGLSWAGLVGVLGRVWEVRRDRGWSGRGVGRGVGRGELQVLLSGCPACPLLRLSGPLRTVVGTGSRGRLLWRGVQERQGTLRESRGLCGTPRQVRAGLLERREGQGLSVSLYREV